MYKYISINFISISNIYHFLKLKNKFVQINNNIFLFSLKLKNTSSSSREENKINLFSYELGFVSCNFFSKSLIINSGN